MFKKNDLVQIKLEVIVKFFDLLAEEEAFVASKTNQAWLWGKLQFIIDFFSHNNLEFITQEKFMELINVEKHKTFFKEENHAITKNNAISMDELVAHEPIVQSMTNVVSSSWAKFFPQYYSNKKPEQFTKKHLFSILNITVFSFLLFAVFYSWKIFGALGLASIFGLVTYQVIKRLVLRVKSHHEQKSITKKVQQIVNPNDNDLLKIFDNIGLEPWTNDREVNEELKKLKNKTIHFISLYKKREKNRHPSMVLDMERMWNSHIPLFIDKVAENSANKSLIIETIKSMENVLQKHMETLFWDDEFEVSVTKRYWLTKETERNI